MQTPVIESPQVRSVEGRLGTGWMIWRCDGCCAEAIVRRELKHRDGCPLMDAASLAPVFAMFRRAGTTR